MSNFKSSFVSTMSDERRKEIAKQVSAAVRVGDMELAGKLAFQIPLSLPRARVLKADWGIERLKKSGHNLDDAVAAYGKEWLEH